VKQSVCRFVLFVSLCASAVGVAASDSKVIEKPVVADTAEKFDALAAEIRKEMSAGGRYEYIRPDDRAKAEADLNSMAGMLKKSGSVAAMSKDERVQLFNAQEHVNGILTHSDSNRLVCERVAPTGSSIPVTKCRTVADIERNRRDTNKAMQDAMAIGSKCAGPNCRGN
jgi:hypothetical protein